MIVPYCERALFAAEPLNTMSNIGFLLAGMIMLLQVRSFPIHKPQRPSDPAPSHATAHLTSWQRRGLWALASLPVAIGLGSAIFHAAPSPLTQVLDIVPIALFALLGVTLLLAIRCRLRNSRIAGVLALWVLATIVAAQRPEWLAGSLFYLPTALLLVFLAVSIKGSRCWLSACALTFSLALAVRTLDMPLCGSSLFGLHTVWHLLAALTCVFALRSIITPVRMVNE